MDNTRRTQRKLSNNIVEINDDMKDAETTIVQETNCALHRIPGCGNCNDADVKK